MLNQYSLEDEGKRIIKDKVRDEINELLKKENIEGRILEVYLDFSLSS
jgi:flagellar basal body-associated protein FliL